MFSKHVKNFNIPWKCKRFYCSWCDSGIQSWLFLLSLSSLLITPSAPLSKFLCVNLSIIQMHFNMVLSSGVQNLLLGLFWPFPVKAIKSWQVLQIVSEWPYNCQHLTCREPNSNKRQRQRHKYTNRNTKTQTKKTHRQRQIFEGINEWCAKFWDLWVKIQWEIICQSCYFWPY